MTSLLIRLTSVIFLAALAALVSLSAGRAENAGQPPAGQGPASGPPATAPQSGQPAPSAPAGAGPSAPAQGAPSGGSEAGKPPEGKSSEGGTGEAVDLPARPFAYAEGKAGPDDIFAAIRASLDAVKGEMDKLGLKAAGRPLAVFVESDESGFRYHAGYPIEAAPDSQASQPAGEVKIGQTPSGKAMRFEHDGPYAEIDATYVAITAYLDEKDINAQDSFIEEYLNDVKDADDPSLQVNIFVLLK